MRQRLRALALIDAAPSVRLIHTLPPRGLAADNRCAPKMPRVDCAEVRLANGDVFTIEGRLEEIEKALSDAARSGQSRLAWFTEHGTNEPLAVNPSQVVALRVSES